MLKLKKRRQSLKMRLIACLEEEELARQAFYKLQDRKSELEKAYKDVDYVLALKDGRYKIISPGVKKKEVTTESIIKEFNIDQINKLAEALGIDLEKGD